MRFQNLDLNLHVALDALLTLRSISSAAERLHISQSSMRKALARLRDYFDDELLPQVGQPAHPIETPFEEHLCGALWRDSRLAASKLTVDSHAAAGHGVMKTPADARPAFERWFMQRFGMARRVDAQTFSVVAAPALVVGTERMATVHGRLAPRVAPALLIVLRPLPVPPMGRAMQWHKYPSTNPGLSCLRRLMLTAVARMDAELAAP